MMTMKKIVHAVLLSLVLVAGLTACKPREPYQLRVLAAGSLLIPFEKLEQTFEARHPDVDVLIEGHGSIQCVRQVTELDELADVVAVADYALIPMLMYESHEPETGEPYATWHLQFATNRLGIAYTPQSAYADEIDADNWYEVISRPGVLLGLADPRFDACGYRALMTTQLAEAYYGDAAIFHRVFGSRLTPSVQIEERDDADVIKVPETLQPQEDSGLIVRGSSVRLLGLLESGNLDYAFEYESVSQQHGLEFLALPPELDLSDDAHATDYARVRVSLDFQRFASVKPEFAGGPIVYGITIPTNAPQPDLAAEFIQFLLSSEGQAIMASNQQPMIVPPAADNPGAIPAELTDLGK
jgi:molybdate/tungstate transport system substrate-binding protein